MITSHFANNIEIMTPQIFWYPVENLEKSKEQTTVQ